MELLHDLNKESGMDDIVLSIVVPVYNEEEVIEAFYERITRCMDTLALTYEIIFVNDGSRDLTISKLLNLQTKDYHMKIIDLSRNFGQMVAVTAGIDYASGKAVVVIHADLQDPPEVIPALVKKWQDGYDVVYGTRTEREGEAWFKKSAAVLYSNIMHRLTNIDIPTNTGEFHLMSRRVIEAVKKFREQHRFMRGLFSWVGFRRVSVPYGRESRFAGDSKLSYWNLMNLAVEGITSFSSFPLLMTMYLGFFVLFFFFVYVGFIIFKGLVWNEMVGGYSLMLAAVLFLGGVQLIVLGIIGEYVWRIYMESKRRPLYFVQRFVGFEKKQA